MYKKSKKMTSKVVAQNAWNGAKMLVCKETELTSPDYEAAIHWENSRRPFTYLLDCSDIAGGATLAQKDKDLGKFRPLAYLSRTLNPSQQMWAPWLKEFWVIRECEVAFSDIVQGIYVEILTDHLNSLRVDTLPVEKLDASRSVWRSTVF